MSYGRSPYYIIQVATDGTREGPFEFFGNAVVGTGIDSDDEIGDYMSAAIEYDAMAQFIATMWSRENINVDLLVNGELKDLIKRGLVLRPELTK